MVYNRTITAELKQWHLDTKNNFVEGIIRNSEDPQYVNGEICVLVNFKSIEYFKEYNIVQSGKTNKYFLMKVEDQL